MTRRALALLLASGLMLYWAPAAGGPASETDTELATGIRQVREGDLDAALITLDGVVKQLSTQKGQAKELARAYTYLAIAYMGLAQQEKAKAKFFEAWKADQSMTLSPKEFPPSIIEFFERAKKEGEQEAGAAQSRPAAPAPPKASPASATSGEHKGGSKTMLLLLGAGGAAAAGVALAAGGGGDGGGTPPPAGPTVLVPNTPTVLRFAFSGGPDRGFQARVFVPGAGSLHVTVRWTRLVDLDLTVRGEQGGDVCSNTSSADQDRGSTSCTGRVSASGTYVVRVNYLEGPSYPGSTEPESGIVEIVYSP